MYSASDIHDSMLFLCEWMVILAWSVLKVCVMHVILHETLKLFKFDWNLNNKYTHTVKHKFIRLWEKMVGIFF